MSVQNASKSDREEILGFCKNTFSWGDYIDQVWDHWISEGCLFTVHENGQSVAVCHAFTDVQNSNLWIEGIRVKQDSRRKKHATSLVSYCEKIARDKKFKTVQMLVELTNSKSINFSEKLGYVKKDIWNLYQLDSKQKVDYSDADFVINSKREKFLDDSQFYFIDSWRWFPLTRHSVRRLAQEKRIVFSEKNNVINGAAVFFKSKHFKDTTMVTLLAGDDDGISNVLGKISALYTSDFERIQVLIKTTELPKHFKLEKRLSFYLVEKIL